MDTISVPVDFGILGTRRVEVEFHAEVRGYSNAVLYSTGAIWFGFMDISNMISQEAADSISAAAKTLYELQNA